MRDWEADPCQGDNCPVCCGLLAFMGFHGRVRVERCRACGMDVLTVLDERATCALRGCGRVATGETNGVPVCDTHEHVPSQV
jgi:hypothetical protein